MTRSGRCDVGRTAVSEAETAAFGGTDLETQLPLVALRARTTAVVASQWWRAVGSPPVHVVAAVATARSSSARTEGGPGGRSGEHRVTVRLARGQHDVVTLAHELAHARAGVQRGHDERFRIALVDVITLLAGPDPAAALTDAFVALGLGLELAGRPWPPPVRIEGETFIVV